MQMIPCGYHRYYYREEEMLNHALEEYQTIGTRAEQVKKTEAELFELYQDPELDHKPEQLQQRGGAYYSDAACETIASIYANKETQIVVSTKMTALFLICLLIVSWRSQRMSGHKGHVTLLSVLCHQLNVAGFKS